MTPASPRGLVRPPRAHGAAPSFLRGGLAGVFARFGLLMLLGGGVVLSGSGARGAPAGGGVAADELDYLLSQATVIDDDLLDELSASAAYYCDRDPSSTAYERAGCLSEFAARTKARRGMLMSVEKAPTVTHYDPARGVFTVEIPRRVTVVERDEDAPGGEGVTVLSAGPQVLVDGTSLAALKRQVAWWEGMRKPAKALKIAVSPELASEFEGTARVTFLLTQRREGTQDSASTDAGGQGRLAQVAYVDIVGVVVRWPPYVDSPAIIAQWWPRSPDGWLKTYRKDKRAREVEAAAGGARAGGAVRVETARTRVPGAPVGYIALLPGSFNLGSPEDEEGREGDETMHRVTLTHGLWLKATEVTVREWLEGGDAHDGSRAPSCVNCPVTGVSWNDAVVYLNGLSKRDGLEPCYDDGGSFRGVLCEGYRLPTEAEWEYAARAGSGEARYGPLDHIAWYSENAAREVHQAGVKQPNAWGFYDLLGNVSEWVNDVYDDYSAGHATDPVGSAEGRIHDLRVWRGGSWESAGRAVRAAARGVATSRTAAMDRGFRPARTILAVREPSAPVGGRPPSARSPDGAPGPDVETTPGFNPQKVE